MWYGTRKYRARDLLIIIVRRIKRRMKRKEKEKEKTHATDDYECPDYNILYTTI